MNHRPNYNNENLHKGIKKNTFKSQVTHLSSHRDYAITFAQNKTNSETFSRIEIILSNLECFGTLDYSKISCKKLDTVA